MKCFICFAERLGFIGSACECKQPGPVEPEFPDNGVVNNGIQVTVNGVNVVNNGA